MPTGAVSAQECPTCRSTNTIRTQHSLFRDSWYCYACGASFDIDVDARPVPYTSRSSSAYRRFRREQKRSADKT